MYQYTNYCTEEQTKKALELGAPIYTAPYFSVLIYEVRNFFVKDDTCYYFPTTEQMINWLEEQGVVITISNFHNEYGYSVSKFENNFDESIAYHSAIDSNNSRKEATLAAIDAALEFLISKTGE